MITTTLYGLKKPEDGDSADLVLFVSDNMDILEAKLNAIETDTTTWDEVTGKPLTFPPPLARADLVGGHRVGNGLTMVGEYLTIRAGIGLLVNATTFALDLKVATPTALGGIMVGTGLTIDANGVLSATQPTPYTLPAATTGSLGGIIVGNGLSVTTEGVLSVTTPATNYTGWIVEVGGVTENIGSGHSLSFVGANGTTIGYNTTTNTVTVTGATLPTWDTLSGKPNVIDNDRTGTTSIVESIWRGTQVEYNGIVTKDPNTVYYIVG
jgi:hypothetical protein